MEIWNQEMDQGGGVGGELGGEVAAKGAKRAISILFLFRYGWVEVKRKEKYMILVYETVKHNMICLLGVGFWWNDVARIEIFWFQAKNKE